MDLSDSVTLSKREKEWSEIEALVMSYQTAIRNKDILQAQLAAKQLIDRFSPLFAKYVRVIKYCDINFYDSETRSFVFSFIEKKLRINYIKNKRDIVYHFKFIVKTYGTLSEEEILSDMYEIFLKLAKRYKQIGRNFCAYVYHVFYFEMNRHIKKYIEDPLNIPYRINSYTEGKSMDANFNETDNLESEDYFSIDWINGISCNNIFHELDAIDRKIIIAYYYEDMNDRQISETLCIHINTVNQRRRRAVKIIQQHLPDGQTLHIKRYRKIEKLLKY